MKKILIIACIIVTVAISTVVVASNGENNDEIQPNIFEQPTLKMPDLTYSRAVLPEDTLKIPADPVLETPIPRYYIQAEQVDFSGDMVRVPYKAPVFTEQVDFSGDMVPVK